MNIHSSFLLSLSLSLSFCYILFILPNPINSKTTIDSPFESLKAQTSIQITDIFNDVWVFLRQFNNFDISHNSIWQCGKELANDLFIKSSQQDRQKRNIWDERRSEIVLNAFSSCGKDISDLGNERECTRRGQIHGGNDTLQYFQLLYTIDLSNNTFKEDLFEVMTFLNITRYYTGFCMPLYCMEGLKRFFNYNQTDPTTKTNPDLDRFFNIYNLSDLEIVEYEKNDTKKMDELGVLSGREMFINVQRVLASVFILKMLAVFVKICFYPGSYRKYTHQSVLEGKIADEKEKWMWSDNSMQSQKYLRINAMSENESLSYNDSLDGSEDKSLVNSKDPLSNNILFNSVISYNYIWNDRNSSSNKDKYPLKIQILKFLDIFDNWAQLSFRNTILYKSTGLEPLIFLRVLMMFITIYNHNVYCLMTIPGKDFLNRNFYFSPLSVFIKYSSFSSTIWIILDGAITSFKLMGYLKQEMIKKNLSAPTIFSFLKFSLLCIPKIFLFLFIYYSYHIHSIYWHNFVPSSTMFSYYQNYILKPKHCMKDPHMIFIPFKTAYYFYDKSKDWDGSMRNYQNCFKFVDMYLNDFYCFILVLLVMYLALKIKNKYFDLGFLFLILIDLCIIPGSVDDFIGKEYTTKQVFGQTISEKKTHIFLSYYMAGVFTGLCYFYYEDEISKNNLINLSDKGYIPFEFCLSIVRFLDMWSPSRKMFWLVIMICWNLWLSSSFFWTIHFFNTLHFKQTYWTVLIYWSERTVLLLISVPVWLLLLVFPKQSALKQWMSSGFFVPFSRCSVAFRCISSITIYLSYCAFILQLKLTYQNILFISIGFFIISSVVSFLLTILLEYPVRKLVKVLIHKGEKMNATIKMNAVNGSLTE